MNKLKVLAIVRDIRELALNYWLHRARMEWRNLNHKT